MQRRMPTDYCTVRRFVEFPITIVLAFLFKGFLVSNREIKCHTRVAPHWSPSGNGQ